MRPKLNLDDGLAAEDVAAGQEEVGDSAEGVEIRSTPCGPVRPDQAQGHRELQQVAHVREEVDGEQDLNVETYPFLQLRSALLSHPHGRCVTGAAAKGKRTTRCTPRGDVLESLS